MIFVLPDKAGINDIIYSDTAKLMKEHFGLEGEIRQEKDISEVNKEIGRDISITKRTPIVPSGSTAEGRNNDKLKLLKILMIVLISTGAVGLIAAAVLFFLA